MNINDKQNINFSEITTLIFDFGGVIINLDREACVHRYEELGIKNANDLLNNYVQSGIFLQLEMGLISPDEFHNELRKIAQLPLTDADIDEALGRFLLDIPTEKLELLLELRKKYRILMLSNTNAIHFPLCAQTRFNYGGHQLSDFFDKCYLSYEMKLSKPNADIFEALLQQENKQAKECLFLDDGLQNIETAQKLGFQTYHVENGKWIHLFN